MNVEVADLIKFRQGTKADHNYVIRTWCHNLTYSPLAHALGPTFLTSWCRIAQGWLTEPSTLLHVLALKNEPRMIVSFVVFSRPQPERVTLHFVYTQQDWRGKGLAHDLVEPLLKEASQISYTHRTPKVSVLPEWKYISPIPWKTPEEIQQGTP